MAKTATTANRFSDYTIKEQRNSFLMDIEKIEIETGHNPRSHAAESGYQNRVMELAEDIKANGLLSPLAVRYDAGRIFLVDGETRYDAIKLLISQGVPFMGVEVRKVEAGDPGKRLVMAMAANNSQPLSKIELGKGYVKLTGYGWTIERIVSSVGKNERFVREAMELANAPEALQQMVAKGQLTDAVVLQQVREKGSAAVEHLTSKVEEAKATGQTGPLKREKVTVEVELAKIVNKISNHHAVREQLEYMEANNAEHEDTVEIPYGLLQQLLKAVKLA